jgi:hypothetical protein
MNKAVCFSLLAALAIAIILVVVGSRDVTSSQDSEHFVGITQPQQPFYDRCMEECIMNGTSGMTEVCHFGCTQGFQYLDSVNYSSKNNIDAVNGGKSYIQNH